VRRAGLVNKGKSVKSGVNENERERRWPSFPPSAVGDGPLAVGRSVGRLVGLARQTDRQILLFLIALSILALPRSLYRN
jgi:hypothetical protein